MGYKSRLLTEYTDLVGRRSKLLDFLVECETNNSPVDERQLKLMHEQFEHMNRYCEILNERILLEMGGDK